ncbi:hypothetical protein R75465_06462 [Paraburkholderia aspalathi]|nr:hypothetical protein R75465_06462 [Paraburkholderia aspalathi]
MKECLVLVVPVTARRRCTGQRASRVPSRGLDDRFGAAHLSLVGPRSVGKAAGRQQFALAEYGGLRFAAGHGIGHRSPIIYEQLHAAQKPTPSTCELPTAGRRRGRDRRPADRPWATHSTSSNGGNLSNRGRSEWSSSAPSGRASRSAHESKRGSDQRHNGCMFRTDGIVLDSRIASEVDPGSVTPARANCLHSQDKGGS